MLAFALTIFAGAFLLFQVQPLIGKYILPWFGGSPGVWTTCMLFFQLLLLGGYAYAHTISRHLRPRTQAIVHGAILLAALLTLPITPGDYWKPHAVGDPTWHILALLTVSLGLPYLVLAATGPLMQEWFRQLTPGASPYRLYALSNIGSLLALVSYPFYFETNFTRQAQARFWSWGLVVYALGCGCCAYRLWRKSGDSGAVGVSEPNESVADGREDFAEDEAHRAVGAERGRVSPMVLRIAAKQSAARPEDRDAPPPRSRRALWLVLPACASILLLAVTNKLCQDVAVIPFLWVLPLALYLLTFIISFDGPRWYSRFYYTIALVGALIAMGLALFAGPDMGMIRQVLIYCGTLFVGCMICHGELYGLRPHPRHLTSFYLMIAAGGAIGGLFVALVAPYIFSNYYEMHVGLALTASLLAIISFTGRAALTEGRWRILFVVLGVLAIYGLDQAIQAALEWLKQRDAMGLTGFLPNLNWSQVARVRGLIWAAIAIAAVGAVWLARRRRWAPPWHRMTCGLMAAGVAALIGALGLQVRESLRNSVLSVRNFYGVLSVYEYTDTGPYSRYYLLQHGRITHGLQFAAPERAREITSYFGPSSGLGLALRHFPRQQNQRIGLLGLGVGTVTAYGKPGDYIRVYEINPQVKAIAAQPFTYLARSEAKIELVMGDARLSMENEPPQNFDFLIMDAFSSDAVPVHLLTREAFEIYRRHLKPDGAILVNISNRYLDLRPVVENAAREFGYEAHHISSEDGGWEGDDGESGWWLYASSWMILSKNREFMSRTALRYAASGPAEKPVKIPLWTDDYTSMFKILQ